MAYRDEGRKDPEAVKHARELAQMLDEDKQERLGALEIEEIATKYFEACAMTGRRPSKPGLALALNVSVDTMDRWLKPADSEKADRHKERRAVIKKALARMSDELQQRTDSMALFLLKQPCYGGYTDKPQGDGAGDTLHVKVTFGGRKG